LGPWAHWPPGLLDDFRKELGRLVEGVFEGDESARMFAPSADMVETESGYEVAIDLPGVQPQDVQIEIKEGQLWISGERKEETEQKGKNVYRVERRFGKFRRVIPLGANVDVEKVEARCKDGVLAVRIPKAEAVKPRRIEVTG
jgi:HSP20 family protein